MKDKSKKSKFTKSTKTEKNESLIRAYLKKSGLSKTSEIANYLGLSPARTRAILSDMKGVAYEGSTSNRKYKLSDNQ